jgi:hypothetical protein
MEGWIKLKLASPPGTGAEEYPLHIPALAIMEVSGGLDGTRVTVSGGVQGKVVHVVRESPDEVIALMDQVAQDLWPGRILGERSEE